MAAIACNFFSWAASPKGVNINTIAKTEQTEDNEPQTECEPNNLTRQLNDTTCVGFFGNKFTLHFDKQQLAQGKVPFVRLSFTNNTGTTSYLGSVVTKETFDSFTRASADDIAKGYYVSNAWFSDRLILYKWQYEVIYLDKATADTTSSIPKDKASDYTIAKSNPKELIIKGPEHHITCSQQINKVKLSDKGVAELEWVKTWTDNFKNLVNAGSITIYKIANQKNYKYTEPTYINGDTMVWKNIKAGKFNFNKYHTTDDYNLAFSGNVIIMSPKFPITFATDMDTANPVADYASLSTSSENTIATANTSWYAYGDAGVLTRVSDNFFESNCSDPNTGLRKYFFSEIATNGNCQQYEHSFFPQPFYNGREPDKTTNLNSDADDALSNRMVSISYPTGGGLDYSKCGLDLNVTVMSDTNTHKECNAIVLVRDDSGKYLCDASNKTLYYLINGKDKGYKPVHDLSKNAVAAVNWWRNNGDGSVIPAIVSNLEFKQVDCGNGDAATYYVDVYVFEGNNKIYSIDDIINGDKSVYTFRYTHAFEPSRTMTGNTAVETAKTVSNVKFYNVAGIESNTPMPGVNVKLTTFTDGTRQAVKIISH